MTKERATVQLTGESAVRVTGVTGTREQDWLLVHKLAQLLMERESTGVVGAIPTYESVLVEFDITRTSGEDVVGTIEAIVPGLDLDAPLNPCPRHFRVPVLYGQELGPDLGAVAEITGLTEAEVIAVHSAPTYTVRCLGSPGGSPMLDGPPLPVQVPRLTSPRTSVPQGAVSLAGSQATITPAVAPGGWCVIGRTPLTVLALDSEPLVPYSPGDTLSFDPIDEARFRALLGRRLAPETSP